MHHFILATKDNWITSGSNTSTTGISERDQNFGKDQILEVKKVFYDNSFDYKTRALIDFSGTDFTNMSQSIVDGNITNPKFYLKLYEIEGNSKLSEEYKLAFQPISQSWAEGTGKIGDNPKTINGSSWENATNPLGGTNTTWSNADGSQADGASVLTVSSSVQSFSNEYRDVEVEITDMVNGWLSEQYGNYGMLIRFSGSQETDTITTETYDATFPDNLKFFSSNTHTIYAPKLEVRWDDHSPCTGSNTGSLNELTMSGLVNNHLYIKGLRESYRENDKVRFRIGNRKKYIQKTFTNSIQTATGSFIAESSGSYAIKDVAIDEFIVPFSDDYTLLSCDSEGVYFNQWLKGFYPDRVYKILLKLKYDDGQEQIFDDDFEFIIRRG